MDLSFLSQWGFSKANSNGVYEIPFIDRMGFVFAICVAGMFIISKIDNRKGIIPQGLEVDRKMFKLSPGFAVGALIVGGILAALFTIYW